MTASKQPTAEKSSRNLVVQEAPRAIPNDQPSDGDKMTFLELLHQVPPIGPDSRGDELLEDVVHSGSVSAGQYQGKGTGTATPSPPN